MSALDIFQYAGQQVRTVIVDGEPWFVAADVAQVLGYRMASDMTRNVDDDEKGTQIVRTPSGDQQMIVISEPGLYEAILRSRVPSAADFKRWVKHDVLPTIRKTGRYGSDVDMLAALPSSKLLSLAAEAAQRAEAAEAKIALDAPKVEYVETFVASEDLRIMRNVAKSLGLSESELRDALIAHHWIYKEEIERWSNTQGKKVTVKRYSPVADKRAYFRPVPVHDAPRFKGEVMHTLKVTPQGAVAISRAAQSWGIVKAVAA